MSAERIAEMRESVAMSLMVPGPIVGSGRLHQSYCGCGCHAIARGIAGQKPTWGAER